MIQDTTSTLEMTLQAINEMRKNTTASNGNKPKGKKKTV